MIGGPYGREIDTVVEPAMREVRHICRNDTLTPAERNRRVVDALKTHLDRALVKAGVVTGEYDRVVVDGLCDGGADSAVQVVIGFIERARRGTIGGRLELAQTLRGAELLSVVAEVRRELEAAAAAVDGLAARGRRELAVEREGP